MECRRNRLPSTSDQPMNNMKHYPIRQSITDRSSISVDLYLKDISKYPLLTETEESETISKMINGDEDAKTKLINSNLRFVISIAKQYQNKGIDLSDLISCGNIGLMKAVSHFNNTYNCKFISYAVWWIRDSILKEILDHGKIIRIPTEKITKFNRINKAITQYEQDHGVSPSLKELSEILNCTEDDLKNIISQCTISVIPDSIVNSEGDIESIFETLYIEEGNTDENLKKQSVSTSILDFLRTNLNGTEYYVLIKFFGLDGQEMSLDNISEACGITKERVRQIKDHAIIKLRKCNGVEKLANFL